LANLQFPVPCLCIKELLDLSLIYSRLAINETLWAGRQKVYNGTAGEGYTVV
jgi:hypothetical protein